MEGINKVMTHLWFDKEAVEAGEFYLKVFENSRLMSRRTIPGTPSGDVDSVTLAIEDHNMMMISAGPYFKVNPSVDYYWEALSADPAAEQCGWLKDKFGVSWQITPTVMNDMMKDADPETLERVTKAFMQMKKFDLTQLEKAYRGE